MDQWMEGVWNCFSEGVVASFLGSMQLLCFPPDLCFGFYKTSKVLKFHVIQPNSTNCTWPLYTTFHPFPVSPFQVTTWKREFHEKLAHLLMIIFFQTPRYESFGVRLRFWCFGGLDGYGVWCGGHWCDALWGTEHSGKGGQKGGLLLGMVISFKEIWKRFFHNEMLYYKFFFWILPALG